jgi:hypothetical protein
MQTKKEIYFYSFKFEHLLKNYKDLILDYFQTFPNHLRSLNDSDNFSISEDISDPDEQISISKENFDFITQIISLNSKSLEKIPFDFIRENSLKLLKTFFFYPIDESNFFSGYLKNVIDRIKIIEDITIERNKVNEFVKKISNAKNLEILQVHLDIRDVRKLGDLNLKNLKEMRIIYCNMYGTYKEDFQNADSSYILSKCTNLRKFVLKIVSSQGFSRYPDIFSIKNVYESRFSSKMGLPYKLLVGLLKRNRTKRYQVALIDRAVSVYDKFLKELKENKEHKLLKRFERSFIVELY